MYAATRSIKARPDQKDALIECWETEVIPRLQETEGFISSSVMSDGDDVFMIFFFESQEALDGWQNSEKHREIRTWAESFTFQEIVMRDYAVDRQAAK